MPLAPVAARMSPFSSDMKPTTIETALRRTTIISMPSSTTDKAKAKILAGEHVGLARDAKHDDFRQRDQRQSDQHRRPDPDDVLDVPLDSELRYDAMEGDRNDDRLEGERNQRRHVEMVGVLHVGLPGHRKRQHHGLQSEDVEQRVKAVLVKQHEADQHQAARQEMGDVEREALHFRVLETNSSNAPRKPSIKAAPTKSGTRNTRILAMLVSNTPSATPPRSRA